MELYERKCESCESFIWFQSPLFGGYWHQSTFRDVYNSMNIMQKANTSSHIHSILVKQVSKGHLAHSWMCTIQTD